MGDNTLIIAGSIIVCIVIGLGLFLKCRSDQDQNRENNKDKKEISDEKIKKGDNCDVTSLSTGNGSDQEALITTREENSSSPDTLVQIDG